MRGLQSVLAPTDFSGASQHAHCWAAMLAGRFEAKLTLLHVVESLPVHDYAMADGPAAFAGVYEERMLRRARAEIHDAASKLAREHSVRAETMLLSGPPSQEIFAAARNTHADLIVMATHGRTGLSHLILGSVAERVLRDGPCPVLAVKQPDAPTRAPQVRRILFPTDLSQESLGGLDTALLLAQELGAHIDFQLVLADPAQYPLMSWEVFPAVRPADFYEQTERHAQLALRDLLSSRIPEGVSCAYHVEHGAFVDRIVQLRDREDHDLIVMSTHGRSGIKRAVLGSVTERVLRKAPCPVLAVRAGS